MYIPEIINQLRQKEPNYAPNSSVLARLKQKQLVMLVSPTAVGKSTIMNWITKHDDRFARKSGFTSRPTRANDEPDLYRYVPHTNEGLLRVLRMVEAGELVQYAIHPTTGYLYGTELRDYPKQYTCADVLGHAIAGFRALPTAGSHTFSIVCNPDEWKKRLTARYPDANDPELQKRLVEASINLSWSIQDSKTVWVDNSNGELVTAAHTIIQITTSQENPNPAHQIILRATAEAMIKYV